MAFFRIIFFLLFFAPAMFFLSGCGSDAFLEAMQEEIDYIAPFDVVLTTEEAKRTTYFPIADTGSTTVVTPGDDASYNNIPGTMNFSVQNNINANGDDIVIDNVSGLTWTKCSATAYNTMDTDDDCDGSDIDALSDSPLMEWSKAAETCKNLDYAGRRDWRLPRLPELLTIVNYGFHPAFDPAFFPNTRGDFEVLQYTDNHYSIDDRTRYIKESNGSYTAVLPGNSNYTAAKYVYEDGTYIFNEDYKDLFKIDDSGTYVRINVLLSEYPQSNRYRYDSGSYIQDNSGYYYKAGTYYIPFGDLYVYDPVWGFEFYVNASGTYVRVYIPDAESNHFVKSGDDFILGAGKYIRIYIPNKKVAWIWDAFWQDYVNNVTSYSSSERTLYSFDGSKFIEDVNGTYIQEFETPLGYWTYSSKLMFDSSMNTADYGWVVFFQNGGPLGVNMATYLLKTKEDLTFEKQFVRCVSGGYGDLDDVNY